MGAFIDEAEAYRILACAGLTVPRHGVLKEGVSIDSLPFRPGESVVLKGIAEDVWHKSDQGLVRFESFCPEELPSVAEAMRGKSKGSWKGLLVAERVAYRTAAGLPSEALVALRRSPEAGWVAILGLGGVHANAWADQVRPLLWPLAVTSPEEALEELCGHLLGRVWLGTLRQGEALTTRERLGYFLEGLWSLVERLEEEGVELLELNPVVIDGEGRPVPLDGVGQADDRPQERRRTPWAPEHLHRILVQPRRIAVAGISSHQGSPGRVILENLQRSTLGKGRILPIKPGEKEILGMPCVPDVASLRDQPVDQLLLALPATKAVRMIEQLCEQGGGAELVYLVPGGLGDGADTSGKGARLESMLAQRRRQGLWAPLLVGPNGVGFLSCEGRLNTLFITQAKLPFEAKPGPLALVSQSGAFLLTCISQSANLPLRYGISIGNQLDARLSDFLQALGCDGQIRILACYVEGFRPGDLPEVVRAIRALGAQGKRVILYKGGRSEAGQAAASSHTGALAGDWELQREVLRRAGTILPGTVGDFDAVMAWLGAYPEGRPGRVAVLTNAGFEAVASADLVGKGLRGYELGEEERSRLSACLAEHGLQDLVAPRLPLDLTPMAGERAFLDCARLLAQSEADTLILGLVPFTQYLNTEEESVMNGFARELKAIAESSGKRIGVAVDAGPEFDPYRRAMMQAGLPVFLSMEQALRGLMLQVP